MSSLSVEYCSDQGFLGAAFEVPAKDMMQDGVPSPAFLEREEEFHITQVPYEVLEGGGLSSAEKKLGVICLRSTDEAYIQRWGQERFNKDFKQYGVDTIWGWKEDSGLLPCSVYLRHCYLAARTMGSECLNSFLDETFLVDRVTTVRQYLKDHPEVLDTRPPPELIGRYSG